MPSTHPQDRPCNRVQSFVESVIRISREKKLRLMFMLTSNGGVQWWQDKPSGRQGMILAETREDAAALLEWLKENQGVKCSIAEIGSVAGETLKTRLDKSLAQGANCAFVVTFGADGQIEFRMLEPPQVK